MKKKNIEALTEIIDGKMTVIASDETTDRVGDSLKVADWNLKDFKKNPVLQAGHDYSPQYNIGIATNIRVEGKKLLFEPLFHEFTELARGIKSMYTSQPAMLKAWSVGFIPSEYSKSETNELLEVSAVAVPANPKALSLMKGLESDANQLTESEEKDLSNRIADWMKEKGCCGTGADNTEALPKDEVAEIEEPEEIVEEKEEDVVEEKDIEEVEEKAKKSPECRQDDESKEECVTRKIPEILKDDPDMEQDQAVAIANDMCDEKCSDKDEEDDDKKGDDEIEIETVELVDEPEEKSGRVISTKNRKIIKSAVSALNNAVIALDKLLEASEEPVGDITITPPEKAKEDDEVKSREPKEVVKSASVEVDAVVLQVLKKIAKNTNFALNKLNRK